MVFPRRFELPTYGLEAMENYKINVCIIKNRNYCENCSQNCVLFLLICLTFAL